MSEPDFNSAKKYTEDQKIQIVRRVLRGEHIDKLADELGIANYTLHSWRKLFGSQAANPPKVKIVRNEPEDAVKQPEKPVKAPDAPKPAPTKHPAQKRYSDEDKAWALKEVESGTPIVDVIATLGCSYPTFLYWREAAKTKAAQAKQAAKAAKAETRKEIPKEAIVTQPSAPTPTPPPTPAAELPKRTPSPEAISWARELVDYKLAYAEACLEIRRLKREHS